MNKEKVNELTGFELLCKNYLGRDVTSDDLFRVIQLIEKKFFNTTWFSVELFDGNPIIKSNGYVFRVDWFFLLFLSFVLAESKQ